MISFFNLIYYAYTVLKKGVKPHFYTWLVWGLISGIAGVGQYVSGGGIGSFVLIWICFSCSVRALLALKYGETNITKSDKIALVFCLVSIVIWQLLQTPLYAIIIVTIIDIVAFYPTIRKTFMKPHQENMISFTIMNLTAFLSLFALEAYNLMTLLYPVAIIILGWAFIIFLIIRRKQLGYKVFA